MDVGHQTGGSDRGRRHRRAARGGTIPQNRHRSRHLRTGPSFASVGAGPYDDLIHDLRHDFASFLINAGRRLYEVQKILSHTQTTQRYATALLRDANVNGPQWGVKLSSRLKKIEGPPDRRGVWCLAGRLIILVPQPGPKAGTANGPSFSVPINHEIGKRRAVGRMEQLCADCQIGQQIAVH